MGTCSLCMSADHSLARPSTHINHNILILKQNLIKIVETLKMVILKGFSILSSTKLSRAPKAQGLL